MTPNELKALREKHQPQPHTEWFPVCATCNTQSPCDVIKVLDAWQASERSSTVSDSERSTTDCEHLTEIDEGSCYTSFTYCPKCGVKL
jgi:hypothetical protein